MHPTDQIINNVQNLPMKQAFAYLIEQFKGTVVFSTSLGEEDQVLTDIIATHQLSVNIFTLDTGRLFNETYELLDKTIARYKHPIQVYFPSAPSVEEFVAQNGINAFYDSVELRKSCCHIRKIEPLQRALQGAKVWVTGLRAEQSDNRKDMPLIAWDEEKQLFKYNPLLHWSTDELNNYIANNNVPINPLHKKGFISIGCAPCTRAVAVGENARAGRWWWEESQKECGLHTATVTH